MVEGGGFQRNLRDGERRELAIFDDGSRGQYVVDFGLGEVGGKRPNTLRIKCGPRANDSQSKHPIRPNEGSGTNSLILIQPRILPIRVTEPNSGSKPKNGDDSGTTDMVFVGSQPIGSFQLVIGEQGVKQNLSPSPIPPQLLIDLCLEVSVVSLQKGPSLSTSLAPLPVQETAPKLTPSFEAEIEPVADFLLDGRLGGLELFWKKEVMVQLQSFSSHHIDVDILDGNSATKWIFTDYYGELDGSCRRAVWEKLVYLSSQFDALWLYAGDLIKVLLQQENTGNLRPICQIEDSRRALICSDLCDLGYQGVRYT
ncbi:UNVERIFIED_CONTAM: hypothetical protein Sradi_6463600 [Sesamum radiatum]|uniref:Uncharacterized protein n=1 Tax=Sesamum radiatum TaxID=300843 RepID=A0AAW2K7P1_SESRA